MIRSLIAPLLALLSVCMLAAPSSAQQVARGGGTKHVQSGDTIRTSDGKKSVSPTDGQAKVTYTGKCKRDETNEHVWIVDDITDVEINSQGGAKRVDLVGVMTCTINKSGTTASSSGNGQGTPPETDGATFTITGDNVKIEANGTNTTIDCKSTAKNTTVQANAGSSGTVTYPKASGFSGSLSVAPGAGGWQMQPSS